MQNRSHQVVLLLFTLAQVAIIFIFGYTPYPDSEGYIALARQCIDGGEPYPLSAMLNTYPFLWNSGAINMVYGSLRLTGSVVPLLVGYALMKGATAYLLYDTVRHLKSRALAGIALLLYVAYPANYGEATSVLGEVPFICLAMLATWLCVVKKSALAAGIVLAIAGWIRPFSLVFLVALALYAAVLVRRWQRVGALLAGYLAGVCIIGTLCYMRTGLFLYQAKTGWMALTDYSLQNAADASTSALDPLAVRTDTTLNVSQKDQAWRRMFFEWLPGHKADYVRQMPRKLVLTYVSDNVNLCTFLPGKGRRDYMYDELSMPSLRSTFPRLSAVQWLAVANLAYYYLLLLAALASLLSFRRQTHLLPVAVVLLGTLMLLFVGHGEARFHQPFMPFVVLLASLFIHNAKLKHFAAK